MTKTKLRLIAVAALTLALGVLSSTPALAASNDAAPPDGQWVAYEQIPEVASSLGEVAAPSAQDASGVSALANGCAAGTENYPSAPRFNCLSVTLDGSGEKVVLRQGASGAFGYLHALLDHNADQQTIEHVISNNAGGYLQPNGRYLYGMGYLSEDGIEILVEVIQERDSSADSPDPYELGVITAYCKDSPGAPTRTCPQWVNDQL